MVFTDVGVVIVNDLLLLQSVVERLVSQEGSRQMVSRTWSRDRRAVGLGGRVTTFLGLSFGIPVRGEERGKWHMCMCLVHFCVRVNASP